jgi:hypothetical protein
LSASLCWRCTNGGGWEMGSSLRSEKYCNAYFYTSPRFSTSRTASFIPSCSTGNGGNRTEFDGRVVDVGFSVKGVVPTMLYSRYFPQHRSSSSLFPTMFLLSPPTSLSRAMLTGARPFSGPSLPFCLPVIATRSIVLSIGAE